MGHGLIQQVRAVGKETQIIVFVVCFFFVLLRELAKDFLAAADWTLVKDMNNDCEV